MTPRADGRKVRVCRRLIEHDAHPWAGLNTRGAGYWCPGGSLAARTRVPTVWDLGNPDVDATVAETARMTLRAVIDHELEPHAAAVRFLGAFRLAAEAADRAAGRFLEPPRHLAYRWLARWVGELGASRAWREAGMSPPWAH